MQDSMLKFQTRPWLFLKEIVKYVLFGTGFLTCPVVDVQIFVNSQHLDARSHLVVSPEQQDCKDPKNLPDIEITPVSG